MRVVLTIAFLQVAGTAFALPGDEYAICLVGQADIALHDQPDALNPFSDSLDAAHGECQSPASLATATRKEIKITLRRLLKTLLAD